MPSQDQEALQSPQTFSFCHPIGTRDGTLAKDARMVNCFLEMSENGMALVKRPGSALQFSGHTGTAQGTFNCNGYSYAIIDDVIYDIVSGTSVAIPSVTTAKQQYYCISDVPFQTSYIKSASGLWKFVGNNSTPGGTFTKVTDPNYPATTVPGLCFLDGIYYVMGSQGEVRGSNFNDGTTWPALNFIQTDLSLGRGAGLYRHLNYLIAYYNGGIQFYFDANAANGNVSQGTQLGPVTNASWTTGLAQGDSVVEMTDVSYFLGRDHKQAVLVLMFNGLEMSIVSNSYIDKITSRSNLAGLKSFGIRSAGHSFYGLVFPDINVTIVYDPAANQWYQWTSTINSTEQYFIGANYLQSSTGLNLMQNLLDGTIFRVDPSLYTDAYGALKVTAITPLYDYGTINYKRIASLFCLGDNINTSITVDFSDDDYQTFTGAKTISMLSTRKEIQRAGRFRRRAYRMVHQDNTPLRLMDGKLDVTLLAR